MSQELAEAILPIKINMESNYLWIVIICLLFSALFSATEIAFVSANRLHVAIQKKKGGIIGKLISKFYEHKSSFITTILIGNTVALVVYGIYLTPLLEPYIKEWLVKLLHEDNYSVELLTLLVQTILSTLIVLTTAEFLPKSISMANPDQFLQFAAIPMVIIYYLMYPITWGVDKLSKVTITKIMRLPYSEDEPPFNVTDLSNYLTEIEIATDQESTSLNSKEVVDREILSNALEFKHLKVRDCMIPRKEIVAIDIEDTVDNLKTAFLESGHSKIPVYKETIDNIIGYCHIFYMYRKPSEIKEMLTDILMIPETMPANELLIKMTNEHKSMALVVDEFGGTSGIVTTEDVVEEIFGEIEDEHDEDELKIQEIDKNTFILSARHEIDHLNSKMIWDLPLGDYDTVGGLILDITHDIPVVGDFITTDYCSFEIISMEGARIDEVKITLK